MSCDPIDLIARRADDAPLPASPRRCRDFLATPSGACAYGSRLLQRSAIRDSVIAVANEEKRQEPDTDILALPTGKCSTLKIAGRDFACRAGAFFQNEQGRANFVIALDDPAGGSHIITFSGDNGRRETDDLYELQCDRMRSTPRTGRRSMACRCRWSSFDRNVHALGNLRTDAEFPASPAARPIATARASSAVRIRRHATTVRRIVRSALVDEKRRTKQIEQLECRQKAEAAKILPRDRTAYIVGCLEQEDSRKPATDQ